MVYGISGIATAGTANSITLDANASPTADIFTHSIIRINAGTGAGQVSRIKWYYATRVAVVQDPWATVPDNTSVYSVFGYSNVVMTANTITLSEDSVSLAQGNYVGCYIELVAVAAGNMKDIEVVGQIRKIVSDDASGTIMTVDKPWDKLLSAGEFLGYVLFGGWGGEAVDVGGRPSRTSTRRSSRATSRGWLAAGRAPAGRATRRPAGPPTTWDCPCTGTGRTTSTARARPCRPSRWRTSTSRSG